MNVKIYKQHKYYSSCLLMRTVFCYFTCTDKSYPKMEVTASVVERQVPHYSTCQADLTVELLMLSRSF